MTTVVDAGPLYALFDRRDRRHAQALDFLKRQADPMITTAPVITEVAFLLRRSADTRLKFLRWSHSYLEIDAELGSDLPRIADILAKYRDIRPDFADASLVALCERRRLRRVASIDKDFAIYRTLTNEPFDNVFGT